MVGEEEKPRGWQRGRKEAGGGTRAVVELNRYAIKRSRGHIKGGPDQGDVTPLLGKIKLMFVFCFFLRHVFTCASVHLQRLPGDGRESARWVQQLMFGPVPARQQGW